jgi:hypothetical protein
MIGTYNRGLVALSVVIAILSSYAALDLAGRVTSAHGRARYLWLSGGAATMVHRHLLRTRTRISTSASLTKTSRRKSSHSLNRRVR